MIYFVVNRLLQKKRKIISEIIEIIFLFTPCVTEIFEEMGSLWAV